MSSCPGVTLEDYLMWRYGLIVDGDGSANPSLLIAEILGRKTGRRRISSEQFAPVVAEFESLRERIEDCLLGYDEEDNGSWRDFSGYAFSFISDEMLERGAMLLGALPPAERRKVTIGKETLRRLARGEAVVIGDVELFAADDLLNATGE